MTSLTHPSSRTHSPLTPQAIPMATLLLYRASGPTRFSKRPHAKPKLPFPVQLTKGHEGDMGIFLFR